MTTAKSAVPTLGPDTDVIAASQRRGLWKRWLKAAAGRIVFGLGLHHRMLRGEAVISLFHRVRDDLPSDDLTCTTRKFDAFCEFFSHHFEVIGLDELLSRTALGQPFDCSLAITFDDGYSDNAGDAARLLAVRSLPATFFVTSDFVETSTTPWWDAACGIEAEWMTWDDVRRLSRAGFTIGAHTKTHVDLGVTGPDEARQEVLGSKRRLEAELGHAVEFFSYPYGREHQISEQNRKVVEQSGFRCCLSATGRTVAAGSDPFRLSRVAVTPWHISPYQWGFELLFGRS